MSAQAFGIHDLQKVPLFRGLNETEQRQIAEVLQMHSFAGGEYIIRQGEDSRNLWVMMRGTCEVSKRLNSDDPDSDSVLLAVLEPPQHFGEMSFFQPAPHSADVRARSDVKVLKIAHVDYNDLIEEGVWAAYKLAYNVVQGLAERMRRMDDWVTDLMLRHKEADQMPEWSEFREKLFTGWTGRS